MNLPTCISSNRKIRYTVCFVILITLSVLFFIVSVCAGSVQIPLSDIWRQFRGEQDELYAAILFQIRIPRTFAAILLVPVGAVVVGERRAEPPLEIVEEEIHKRLLSGGSVPVGETETEMVPEGVLHVALGDAEVPFGLPGFAAAGALVQGHIVGRRELRVELGL